VSESEASASKREASASEREASASEPGRARVIRRQRVKSFFFFEFSICFIYNLSLFFFCSHVGHRILGCFCLFLDHQKREGGTLNKCFIVIGKVGATRRRSRSNQPPPQLRLGTHIFLIS